MRTPLPPPGFYQSPQTYTASKTNLTVLGYLQEYQNGVDLRSAYLTNASDSISGINATQAELSQVNVLADAGGEGGVIVESANALLQGLFPPYNDSITLANGTTVTWPSGRAQLIPIETIEPDQAVWMEGWTSCNAWTDYLADFYASADFKSKAVDADAFYQNLSSVLGNRPLTLENAYNIYDYMNVNYIHNATLRPAIEPHLEQARAYSDYHESGAFVNADSNHIANIAGQAFLPPLLDGLNQAANASSGLKIQYLAVSYKPFMALFNMMDLPSPLSTSLVEYASAAVFEVRDDDTVTFKFRNGTDGSFATYPLFGGSSDSMALSDFHSKLQPYSLDSLAKWCDKCSTPSARGCDVLAALNGTGGGEMYYAPVTSTTGRHHVSPVVAGVIGSMVSLALAAVLLAAWLFFGGMAKRQRRAGAGAGAQGKQSNGAGFRSAAAATPASSGFELGGGGGASPQGSLRTASHSEGGAPSKHVD